MTVDSPPSSTPPPPGSPELPPHLQCQTDECPGVVRIITTDLSDNHSDLECLACYLGRNMALIKELVDNGTLVLPGAAAQSL
jgi:hypothetical protein